MSYQLEYSGAALDDLERLARGMKTRVWASIQALAHNPRPPGCQALRGGLAGYLKIRVGDFRVAYVVEKDVVFVTRIGNRRDIYKQLRRG